MKNYNKITVKELMEKLSNMPDNATFICVDYCEGHGEDSHMYEVSYDKDCNYAVLEFDR